jgi:hypothetical protein
MSPDVKRIYDTVARLIENEIRNQAPSSKIASGTTVIAEFSTDGEVSFVTVIEDKVKYGIYLDKGTGQYYTSQEGPWDQDPGKGQDGIRPRFWTSLNDAFMERISMMIEEAIVQAQEKEFEEQLQEL